MNSRILSLASAYVPSDELEELTAETVSVLHSQCEVASDTEYIAPEYYGCLMLICYSLITYLLSQSIR